MIDLSVEEVGSVERVMLVEGKMRQSRCFVWVV
jgi:hypothetical protein